MKKRTLEIKDLEDLKFVGLPELEPNGKRIFYPVKEIYRKEEGEDLQYKSDIWCYDFDRKKSFRFSNSSGFARNPKVSGNGKYLAYLLSGEDCPLRLIPLCGGESSCAWDNDEKYSISSFSWSPDSKFIALAMKKARTEKEKKKKSFEYIENLYYKADGGGVFTSDGKFELWMYNVETKDVEKIFSDRFNNLSPVWSPDGKKLLFSSNKVKNPDYNLENNDFYLYDIKKKSVKKITNEYGSKSNPSFSLNGKYLAYIGNEGSKIEVKHRNVHLRLVKTTGKGRSCDLLLKKPDLIAIDYVIGDMKGLGEIDPTPLWKDNDTIIFTASYKGSCNLYSINLNTEKLTKLESNEWEIATIRKCGEKWVTLITDPVTPPEIYEYKSGKFNKLTSHNKMFEEEINLTMPEEHWIETEKGVMVQGWMMKPSEMKKNKKYPAIMEVHGGPHVLYGWSFFFEFHLLAAAGYAVFYINPRGSQGYGEDFCNAIRGDWGKLDWLDIKKSAEYFMDFEYIDEKKVGITGGSYGGYMTNWAIGHTNMFKAAVTQRSVVNCHNFFGTSDAGFYFIGEVANGKPWEKPMNYMKVSPLSYVKNVNTPLLIIHSEGDQRTPIEQGEQLFTALKLLRKKCAFLRFDGESHDLSRTGSPKNRMARLAHIIKWFNRYLKNPIKNKEIQVLLKELDS